VIRWSLGPRWWLALLAALGLVAAVLTLPAPHRPPGANSLGAVAAHVPVPGPTGLGASAPGPTLHQVWPAAVPIDVPAILPDGTIFTPLSIVDPNTVLGTAAPATSGTYRLLVLRPAPSAGAPSIRVLWSRSTDDAPTVDALAATASALYWTEGVSDASGVESLSLWAASRSGGAARRLVTDMGPALFQGSGYDLQVAAGRAYWIVAPHGDGHPTALRSVAVSGGRVTTRALPGDLILSGWPWLVSSPAAGPGSVELFNVDTGRRRRVPAPATQQLTCTPAWCRMVGSNVQDATEIVMVRTDGTGRRRVGDQEAVPAADDPALLDRFELLARPDPTTTPTIVIEQVRLVDLTTGHSVLLEAGASGAGGRGGFVWWSTGNNEALAWHALDLRTLH
jgi:hypothetical protein